MKKFLLVLISAMFGFTCLYSNDTSYTRDEPYLYESEYETYNTSFTPLTANETLSFDPPNSTETTKLVVYRTSSDKKEILGVWKDVIYGAMQTSANGKKLVFQMGRTKKHQPVFMINGNTGKIYYCCTVACGLRADKNLDYLITNNHSDSKFYSEPYNSPIEIPFYVVSLIDGKLIRQRTWPLLNHLGILDFNFSLVEGYDFALFYSIEIFTEAYALYNVEKDLFTVITPQDTKEYDFFDYEN